MRLCARFTGSASGNRSKDGHASSLRAARSKAIQASRSEDPEVTFKRHLSNLYPGVNPLRKTFAERKRMLTRVMESIQSEAAKAGDSEVSRRLQRRVIAYRRYEQPRLPTISVVHVPRALPRQAATARARRVRRSGGGAKRATAPPSDPEPEPDADPPAVIAIDDAEVSQ